MIFDDKNSDCYKITEKLNEAEKCLLENITHKHIPNYRPNVLTQEIDRHFGQSRMVDCIHRYIKSQVGIRVY